jgi:hypothetical protein
MNSTGDKHRKLETDNLVLNAEMNAMPSTDPNARRQRSNDQIYENFPHSRFG